LGAEAAPASRPATAATRPAAPRKVQITVSRETTFLLGPLNADGTVNYVAATNELRGKDVTAENNAAIPLIRAIGPDMLAEPIRAQTLRRLGIQSLPPDGQYYLSPRDYLAAQHPDANMDQHQAALNRIWDAPKRGPCSPADNPLMAEWFQGMAKPLSLVVEASRRPRYFIPLVSTHNPPRMQEDQPLVPGAIGPGMLVRVLSSRAMLEAGAGRFDSALADLQAARRLARLLAQPGLLIDQVVASATDGDALEGFASLAASGKLDARQARQLLAALEPGPVPPAGQPLRQQPEMLFGLDFLTRIGRDGLDATFWPGWVDEDKVRIPDADLDIDEMLRMDQRERRACAAADALPTYTQRAEARKRLDQPQHPVVVAALKEFPSVATARRRLRFVVEKLRTASRKERAIAVYEAMSAGGLITTERLSSHIEGARVRLDITRLACALAVARLETGRYPDRLADLAPKCIPAVPNDAFTDKPLVYRRTADGFLLYSLGPNQRDDGGQRVPRDKDDIAVRAPN
jgi:hypothetical protein